MIRRTTKAAMPRPMRLRKKVSPPVPVSSGPAMSNATPTTIDASLCRLMKPTTLTAAALSWPSQGGGRPVAPARRAGRNAAAGTLRLPGAVASARGVKGGAPVGRTTTGNPREISFPEDLLRRHHLYVARTRMGKSTLMQHVVAHKLREKAAGRDGDAIVGVDPHADLVDSLLEQVPESIIDQVKLIDLTEEWGTPRHKPAGHPRVRG